MKKISILVFFSLLISTLSFSQIIDINTKNQNYDINKTHDSIKAPPPPCLGPDVQATAFSATPSSTSIVVNWVRGDGDGGVLVLIHQSSAVDSDPVSGISYTANNVYGSGDEIGTGNFVVYNNTGTSVTVTGLNSGTTYYFAIYEYNATGICYKLTELTGNGTTTSSPTVSNVSPDNFFADKGKQLTITGTNLTGATVTIGGVSGTINSNDGTTVLVTFPAGYYSNNTLTLSTGISPDATYTVTVNKRNIIPVGGGTDFHTTIQSALNGLYAWYGTTSFAAGQLPGAKTIDVYNGTYSESVTPNINLLPTASENLIIQNHTAENPVVNATGQTYGFNIGELDYVQVIGFTIYGATGDNIYTEGDYNIISLNKCYSSTAGSGITLYTALGSTVENNLVYNNYNWGLYLSASNNVIVKNNTVANNGHESKAPPMPAVYEPAQLYVQSGTGVSARNNIFYSKSGSFIFAMKTEAGVTITSDYNTYFKNGNTYLVFYNGALYSNLSAWTGNGAGANDLESNPDFVNVGSNDFHIHSTWGSYTGGSWPPNIQTGGVWVLDATNSPALDAGNPVDTYINEPQSGNRINQGAYGNTVQASKSVACIPPTTQATVFAATPYISTIDLTWTRGNGDFVIIVAHQGAAVDSDPVDGTTYIADPAFGSGTQIGTGNYVVYIGNGTGITVTGLTSSTQYYFAIYEFTDASKCYLIPALTGNATTIAISPVIANVSPDNFFTDKGKQLTITGSYLTGATITLGGVAGIINSNDGSTILVTFPAGYYVNNTLTLSTGIGTDATTTVIVNKRNIIPVGGGTDFHTTITSALNGLQAWYTTTSFDSGQLPGEKIIDVYNGTYSEMVIPNITLVPTSTSYLTIQNHFGENPVINATGLANGFYIGELDYVQITGFTVYGANADNIFTMGDYNIINMNKCYNSIDGSGISLNTAVNASLINNLIYNNFEWGIHLSASNNVSIKNNTIVNNGNESKAPPVPTLYYPAQLYINSGTGTIVQNNIFYSKSGSIIMTVLTENGVTFSSDFNTYFKNGNAYLVNYNGHVYADLAAWTGNGAGVDDLESDPDFVNLAGNDFHIHSTWGSYIGGIWPPAVATGGVWVLDVTNSPALDAGNPADLYANEPQSGNRINQGAYGNTAQASKSAVSDIYWDGSTSIDWQDITNWTPEYIPLSGNNAIIPALCPNYPVVDDNATTAECLNLQINAGASVTIATSGQMTVHGTITNSQGVDGLIIQSDATGDGSLIQNSGAVPATVQRYMSASKWHFMFSPLSALPISVLTGGTNPNFYYYNEANADYWNATLNYGSIGWTTVATANCELNKGYILYHTVNTTYNLLGGNLFDADKIFDVSYTLSGATNVTVPVLGDRPWSIFDGWMLVGNPYTSSIDWDLVSIDDVENGIYYYDGTNYRYYMQGGNGIQNPPYDLGISLNGGSRYVPAGQGFFVKTVNTGSTHTGTFTIPKTARVHNNQLFYKETVVIPDLLRMQIVKGDFADETVVRSILEATDNHNPEFDAYKMFSWDKTLPQIYTLNDNNNAFAINTIPVIEGYKQVRMGIYSGENMSYTIQTTELNYSNTRIYLEDTYNGSFVYLNENPDYTFNSETGTFEDRFILHFNPNTAPYTTGYIPDQETFVGTEYQYSIPEGLFYDEDADEKLTYVATLVSGNSLPSWLTFNPDNLSFSGISVMSQILDIIVTATDIFGESVSDVFELNVKNTTTVIENKDFEVEIFPVPALDKVYLIVGGTVKNYKVEINSMSGKNIYTNSFSNDETNVINLDLFASGVYSMTITFDDNTKIIRKLIIQ